MERTVHERLVAELPRIRGFLRRLAPGREEDLAQDAMARALRYRHSIRDLTTLRGWLLRIAFRAYLDDQKRWARSPRELGDDAEAVPAPRDSAGALEDREHVEQLLARLSPIEAAVILGFHRDGLSLAELSRKLELPEGTVKSHLHRARRKLARNPGDERTTDDGPRHGR